MDLERWNLESRCVKSRERVKEVWVRVVGLTLHLWMKEILKLIGKVTSNFERGDLAKFNQHFGGGEEL